MNTSVNVSHEAKAFKSIAQNAMEEAVHTAKLEYRRGARRLEDLREEAGARIRRRPFVSVGTAFSIGMGVASLLFIVGRALARTKARPSAGAYADVDG
jgi:hypothetical protein